MARLNPPEAKALEQKLAVWSTGLLPEALGSLLGLMVSEPDVFETDKGEIRLEKDQTYALQQLTISRLVDWLADKEGATLEQKRHHFTEAVIRMHSVHVHDKVAAYQRNLKELDNFMANIADEKDISLKDNLFRYKQARNTLSNKAFEHATPVWSDSGKDYPKVERKGWSLFK